MRGGYYEFPLAKTDPCGCDIAPVASSTANITLSNALTSGLNTLSAAHRDKAGNRVTGSKPLESHNDQISAPAVPVMKGYTATSVNGTAEANATLLFSTSPPLAMGIYQNRTK